MSLQDDLTDVRRKLNDLTRSVERLEQDVARQAPVAAKAPDTSGMVDIPDTPYDNALWTDTDDEGLGARDRRAP
ncbi:hypothetical protein [Streptomyces sp. NPDC012888]|uniref:hypothetical protein n=1 Tax=Streptomyces sp. NPDC012888 TaxID=3364855 RepID=UPI00368E5382